MALAFLMCETSISIRAAAQIDGRYLSPGGFRRGSMLVEPMLRKVDSWHPAANEIGPLGNRASVTISTPVFTL